MTKTGSILPDETLNAILRTGSNHNRTELRLIYNFMSVQTKEEYEEFVRNEYGNGGKGFIIDGKKYAVWFNKNGILHRRSHLVKQYAQKIRYIYLGSR